MQEKLLELANKIGIASSKAQGLNHVITSFSSFVGGDNIIYLLLDDDDSQVVGFVKVGRRNLFLYDRTGVQHEVRAMCLLDFFTFPICQRCGNGRRMIDKMLQDQNLEMKNVPIDKPSPLCLNFMNKHFGLREFVEQPNNYVVFDQYWEDNIRSRSRNANQYPHGPKPLLTPNHKPKPRIMAPLANPYYRSPQPRRQNLNPITWLPYD